MRAAGVQTNDLEKRFRQAMAELEQRLLAGEPCRAESFFEADPALAADTNRALDLIFHEYTLRGELGQRPAREEYYQRFPQWRNELQHLFDVEDSLGTDPLFKMRIEGGPESRLEHYQIIKVIGNGPLGRVCKVRQLSNGSVAALKTLSSENTPDVDRFRMGVKEQADLKHPNIVQVFDIGVAQDGSPCFSMEFAEGGNLEERIHGKPQPAEEAARLVRTLAEAMEYAHRAGVVHRDLKPANVVLTADDVAKVTDFGLAKRLDTEGSRTPTGEILGTPPYMAPEQAAGRAREIGPHSDVYSLGAILYEMLTGRPPFQGKTLVETLQKVLTKRPIRPRKIESRVPRALESICLKCLEKKPRRRYGSAQELAGDLGRWLSGERPSAHSWFALLDRTLRRHALAATATLLFVCAAVVVPMVIYLSHPDRIQEWVQRELEQGRPVTLMGESGRPLWSQWRTAKGDVRDFLSPDGYFTVENTARFEPGLLELITDPKRQSYRMSVMVRHNLTAQEQGKVGVYFAYSRDETFQGSEHFFCTLEFNDAHDLANSQLKAPGNMLLFNLRGFPDTNSQQISHALWAHYFPHVPMARGSEPWHRLVLEATPKQVRTFWDNVPAVTLTRSELDQARHAMLADQAGEKVAPFAVQSALGLYLFQASASFQGITIEPLGETD